MAICPESTEGKKLLPSIGSSPNDNKTTAGKPSNATSGGTYVQTNKTQVDTHATVTNTLVVGTETVTKTHTREVTVTVPKTDKGPGLPDGKGKDGK